MLLDTRCVTKIRCSKQYPSGKRYTRSEADLRCDGCNYEFIRSESSSKATKHFCSRACANANAEPTLGTNGRSLRLLTEEEINVKLDRHHHGNIRIDYATYVNKGSAARFVYQDTGEEFWAKAENAWNGHQSFKRGRTTTGIKKRTRIEVVVADIHKQHGNVVQMDETTYVSSRQKARFIDRDYGEWWSQPASVRKGSGHPKRGQAEVDKDTKSQKCHETMKRNGTYCTSTDEERFYGCLCVQFRDDDIVRQVPIRGKRWLIDFYVKSIDTYIQLDGVYWYGLDRPLDVIAEHKTERDENIHNKWLTDRTQDAWFKERALRLVRITDEEFKAMGQHVLEKLRISL